MYISIHLDAYYVDRLDSYSNKKVLHHRKPQQVSSDVDEYVYWYSIYTVLSAQVYYRDEVSEDTDAMLLDSSPVRRAAMTPKGKKSTSTTSE